VLIGKVLINQSCILHVEILRKLAIITREAHLS